MGHSINSFREGNILAHDSTVLIWIYLFLQVIDELPSRSARLTNLHQKWKEQAEWSMNGAVSLELEELLTDSEMVSVVRKLSLKVIEKLQAKGEFLSADYLNDLASESNGGIFKGDSTTLHYIIFGEALIDLLDGKITGLYFSKDAKFNDEG